MTCNAEIHRSFRSHADAFGYLTARGFLCVPHGWENGRWSASVEANDGRIDVAVWLRAG